MRRNFQILCFYEKVKEGTKSSFSLIKTVIKAIAFCVASSVAFQLICCGIFNGAQKNKSFDMTATSHSEGSSSESDDYINLLLLGEDEAASLTDVIMIVSLNTDAKQINVLQIPRDTYAEYTTASYRKLNAAKNVLGDGKKVAEFLSENLGIRIDHYAVLGLDAVSKTVDALGGIEIDVPNDMVYDDPYQDLSINIKKGRQILDGEKAKQFIRYRAGYIRGDLDRLDAQKLFLTSLLKKVSDIDMHTIIKIAATVIPMIESDISYGDCISMIKEFGIPRANNITLVTLPGGDVRGSSGAWYYIMNKKASYEIIRQRFFTDISFDEFDKCRSFTNILRPGFNDIYEAAEGYEALIY